MIAGRASLDEGEARLREGARVVLVEQEPSLPQAGSLRAALLLRGHVPRSRMSASAGTRRRD